MTATLCRGWIPL